MSRKSDHADHPRKASIVDWLIKAIDNTRAIKQLTELGFNEEAAKDTVLARRAAIRSLKQGTPDDGR